MVWEARRTPAIYVEPFRKKKNRRPRHHDEIATPSPTHHALDADGEFGELLPSPSPTKFLPPMQSRPQPNLTEGEESKHTLPDPVKRKQLAPVSPRSMRRAAAIASTADSGELVQWQDFSWHPEDSHAKHNQDRDGDGDEGDHVDPTMRSHTVIGYESHTYAPATVEECDNDDGSDNDYVAYDREVVRAHQPQQQPQQQKRVEETHPPHQGSASHEEVEKNNAGDTATYAGASADGGSGGGGGGDSGSGGDSGGGGGSGSVGGGGGGSEGLHKTDIVREQIQQALVWNKGMGPRKKKVGLSIVTEFANFSEYVHSPKTVEFKVPKRNKSSLGFEPSASPTVTKELFKRAKTKQIRLVSPSPENVLPGNKPALSDLHEECMDMGDLVKLKLGPAKKLFKLAKRGPLVPPGKCLIRELKQSMMHLQEDLEDEAENEGEEEEEDANNDPLDLHAGLDESLAAVLPHLKQLAQQRMNEQIGYIPDNTKHLAVSGNLNPMVEFGREKRNVVLYFASNNSDTQMEREQLHSVVQPFMIKFCELLGWRWELVDMQMGMREQLGDDHFVEQVCFDEIRRCRSESAAAAFAVLLGDKSGQFSLPRTVPAAAMDVILEHMREEEEEMMQTSATPSSFVEDWYIKDENAVPPHYVLQPISSRIMDFLSDQSERRLKASARWEEHRSRLLRLLQEACKSVSKKNRSRFFTSPVAEEIRVGIAENQSDRNSQCFVMMRTFRDLKKALADYGVEQWLDCVVDDAGQPSLDKEPNKLINHLKSKIHSRTKLPDTNVRQWMLNWTGKGLSPESNENHAVYLENFASSLTQMLGMSILRSHERTHLERDVLFEEILQHRQLCFRMAKLCLGRASHISKIDKYFTSHEEGPLVVYGEPGMGKTTMLSKAAMNTSKKRRDCVMVLRFCGTTPSSRTARTLLTSVCKQLQCAYKIPTDPPTDYQHLVQYFQRSINRASIGKPLFLVFDGVDQLSDQDHARNLLWLPATVPPHVKLVVSTGTTAGGCYNALRRMYAIQGQKFGLKVTPLPEHGKEMLTGMLSANRRCVTEDQETIILESYEKCPVPLFLSVASALASTWTSDDIIIKLASSLEGIVDLLIAKWESQNGAVLTKRALSYIASTKHGLSRRELEDVLSCDDKVLDSIFQWWAPLQRRVPQYCWRRLRKDVGDFLVEYESGDQSLISFLHSSFESALKAKYFKKDKFSKKIHGFIASYFANEWERGKPDPNCDDPEMLLPRGVLPQPLFLKKSSDNHIFRDGMVINYRRLHELPHALRGNKDVERLVELLTDLRFIEASFLEGNFYDFLYDYIQAMDMPKSKELQDKLTTFWRFLRSEGPSLKKYPFLTVHIAHNQPDKSLVSGVAKECPVNNPWLLHCNKSNAMGAKLSVLNGHSDVVLAIALSTDSTLLASGSADHTVKVWDTVSGEERSTLYGHSEAVTFVEFCDDNQRLLTCSKDGMVFLWTVKHASEIARYDMLEWDLFVGIRPEVKEVFEAVEVEEEVDPLELHDLPVIGAMKKGGSNTNSTGRRSSKGSVSTLGTPIVKVESAAGSTPKSFKDAKEMVKFGTSHSESSATAAGDSQNQKDNDTTVALSTARSGRSEGGSEGWIVSETTHRSTSEKETAVSGGGEGESSSAKEGGGGNAITEGGNNMLSAPGGASEAMTEGDWSDGASMSERSPRSKDNGAEGGEGGEAANTALRRKKGKGTIVCARYNKGSLMIACRFRVDIGVYDATQAVEVMSVRSAHEDLVTSMVFASDMKKVFTAGMDGVARVWDMSGAMLVETLRSEHIGVISSLHVADQGNRLVCGYYDGSMRVWDAWSGKNITRSKGHASEVRSCHLSSDGRWVATGSKDTSVRIWDSNRNGQEKSVLHGHTDAITQTVFSEDMKLVASASWDKTVRLWDISDLKVTSTALDAGDSAEDEEVEGHTNRITHVTFSPLEGRLIATTSLDGNVCLWDGYSGNFVHKFKGHAKGTTHCTFNKWTTFLLSSSKDATIKVWSLRDNSEHLTLMGHSDTVNFIGIPKQNDSVYISASADGTVRSWDVKNGMELQEMTGHNGPVVMCAFCPVSSKIVASASMDGTLAVWDHTTGACKMVMEGHNEGVDWCTFSKDGKKLFSRSFDCSLRVWDVFTGNNMHILQGHFGLILGTDISPASQQNTLLTCADDMTIRVWNPSTGKETTLLQGHEDDITSCHFLPDSKYIVTSSTDSTLRVWDLEANACIAMFANGAAVTNLVVSETGRFVAAVDSSHKLVLLQIQNLKVDTS